MSKSQESHQHRDRGVVLRIVDRGSFVYNKKPETTWEDFAATKSNQTRKTS